MFGPLDGEIQRVPNLSGIVKASIAVGIVLVAVGISFERLGRKWLAEDEDAWKGRLVAKLLYGSAAVLETAAADRPKVIRTIGHRVIHDGGTER